MSCSSARHNRCLISVVIPVYNGAEMLPGCLEALRRQTVAPELYEVIVVDDGSGDGSADVAPGFGVKAIRRDHRGAAAARNAGIAIARGDVVLFTDADCAPAPDWIEQMVAPFADPSIVGVKGVYRTRQAGLLPRFVQLEYEDKYDRMAGCDAIDFVDTYSAAYRRSVLLEEGFDVTFPAASVEDIELSFRLAAGGHRLVFNPRAVVYHRHPSSLWQYVRRKLLYGYWRVPVYARHPARLGGDSHTPSVLKWQLGLVGAMLILAPVILIIPILGWLWAGIVVAFCLSTLPFCVKALRRDALVAVVSPPLLWLRALALGLGLAWGLARHSQTRLILAMLDRNQF
jgi:cellulose synthase/poly-beta-1,6-N-acetylglucosamine synthase-like glycosyltransferase